MALDRQRILSELGSVVNQLQSADCGCMGKLFSDSRQAASSSPVPAYGGCRHNCCHGHGHGNRWNSTGSCGDPYQGDAQNMNTHCMGHCNPAKLYTETYNYLTDNLMQPTIKEVYNDLKSLTPENTVANNPRVKQLGFSPNGLAAHGNINAPNMGNMQGTMNEVDMGSMNACNMGNNFTSQPTNVVNATEMGVMGGMGPQIMKMLDGNMVNKSKSNNQQPHVNQPGHLQKQMMTTAPQTPTGHNGVTSLPAQMKNQDIFYAHSQNNCNPGDHDASQSMLHPNVQNMQLGRKSPNAGTTYPTSQQLASGHLHGAHSKGIAKFKEMFPGVVKNMGGDLGFDPMEIAIQMNPANQQQAAMNTMNKMMQSNNLNKVFDPSTNSSLGAGKGLQQNQIQNNVPPQSTPSQQAYDPTIQTAYQSAVNNANIYGNSNAQHIYTAGHTAVTNVANQQDILPEQQYQQQNITDPNISNTMTPSNQLLAYEATPYQKEFSDSPNVKRMIKEPILPADSSRIGYMVPNRQQYFEYNTLGQPVEKCAADVFRTPVPNLPQTLSPQPIPIARTNAAKYSNVKSTVSKTSLMGAKAGRTPSQLQLIYNQYKGSQSFTQQNIGAPVNNATHSEGKLNASQIQHRRQMPVEKVGGDTAVNNNMMRDERAAKVEHVGQNGDAPTEIRAVGDRKTDEMAPVMNRKTRNGLQDMVYTSYPTSAAWSFHGERSRPYSYGRNRFIRR